MALEIKHGPMEQSILENGEKTEHTGKDNSFMLMGIFMMASGQMTRQMASEFINILMELNTKACGKTIFNTEEESKHGRISQDMKENTGLERNMA